LETPSLWVLAFSVYEEEVFRETVFLHDP
jgi:hypothetical protein